MAGGNRSARFARNAVANWLVFAFIAAVSFFLSPFIVNHLGAQKFGIWTLLGGLVGYLGLLDFSIRTAVNRYVAKDESIGAHEECSSTVSAATRLILVLSVLAVVLAGVFSLVVPYFFNIPEELVPQTRLIIVVAGLAVAASLIAGVFGGVITGLERFDISACIEIFVTFIRSAGFIWALLAGYGLTGMALAQLGSAILNLLLSMIVARKLYPQLHIRLRGSFMPQIRKIIAFSMTMTLVYVLSQFIYYSDSLVIAAMLPIEQVTFYAIAGNLCLQVRGVAASLSYLMTPRVSALTSMGSSKVGQEIVMVSGFATLVAAPIALTFAVRGESFITLWMGPQYGPISGAVLQVLAVVVWLEASRSVVMHSFIGKGRQRTLLPGIAAEAVSNVLLSILLVAPLGVIGVAYGTLIPFIFISLWYFPSRLSREMSVSMKAYYRDAIMMPTIACLPFAVLCWVIEKRWPAANLPVFFGQVLLSLPLVPVAWWFVCNSPAERQRLRAGLSRKLAAATGREGLEED